MAYFFVNNIMGNYGWLTIFNFTLIGIDPYPENIIISNNFMDYIKPYIRAAWGIANNLHGLIYLLSFTIWTYSAKTNGINKSNRDLGFIVCLIFVVLHMLAFPVYMDRFFTFAAYDDIHQAPHLKTQGQGKHFLALNISIDDHPGLRSPFVMSRLEQR